MSYMKRFLEDVAEELKLDLSDPDEMEQALEEAQDRLEDGEDRLDSPHTCPGPVMGVPKTAAGCPICNPDGPHLYEDEYACRRGGGPCGE